MAYRPEEPAGGSQSVRRSEEAGSCPWSQGTQGSGGVKIMTNDERNRAAAVAGATLPPQAADIRQRLGVGGTFGGDGARAEVGRAQGADRQRAESIRPPVVAELMVCGAGAVEFGMPLLCSGFLWRPTDKSAGCGRIARRIRREKWRVPRYIGSSNGRLGLIKPVGRSRGAHAFLALAVYARWETFQYTTAGMSRSGPTDRDSWRGSQPVARVSLSVGASGLLGLLGCGRGGTIGCDRLLLP